MNNRMRQIMAQLDSVLASAQRLDEKLARVNTRIGDVRTEVQSQERCILVAADGIGQAIAQSKTGHRWHAAHRWHGPGGLKKTGHFG